MNDPAPGDRPPALSPGSLAKCSFVGTMPLFDSRESLGKMSVRVTRWAPADALFLVLALVHARGGHKHVMVLFGQGQTGWCWGGHLEPVTT